MKRIFYYLKGIVDFGRCFRKNIKDAIMRKVHFDKDVNCS